MEVTDSRALSVRYLGGLVPMGLLVVPFLALGLSLLGQSFDYFDDRAGLLVEYWLNTLGVLSITAVVAYVLGTLSAWVLHTYTFPGKTLLGIALALPLAIPPYLSAYTLLGFFDITGPLSQISQTLLGRSIYLSFSGPMVLGTLMGFQLYPYVLLMVLPALQKGLRAPLEAARTLGKRGFFLLWNPGLALVRPFAVAGTALVVMEAMGEYGAALHLGVPTVTYGMFRAWHHAWDLGSAMLMGVSIAIFALVLVGIETLARDKKRFSQGTGSHEGRWEPIKAKGLGLLGVYGLIMITLGPGLLLPVVQLLWWLVQHQPLLVSRLIGALGGSLALTLGAGLLVIGLSMVSILATRGPRPQRGPWQPLSIMASATYATPSMVVALGVMLAVGGVQGALVGVGLGVLILALTIRFFSIAHNNLATAWDHRIQKHLETARIFEGSWVRQSLEISLPLWLPALGSSAILLAMDISKELNATLLLRPLGFETLPTLIFEQASQELPHLAAIPGLLLITLTGALTIVLYRRNIRGN